MSAVKNIRYLFPPPKWRFPVIIMLGVLTGMIIAIFHISNASSYLSNDPLACMNCHVMTPQFATWQKSSHANAATCNDCHVPHDNLIRTYLFKASDGMRHATMFTFRLEPEVIRIKDAGKKVVQENCIRCHYEYVNTASIVTVTGNSAKHNGDRLCWDCHRETPHGTVNSLSSFPFARVPQLTPVMPDWLEKFTELKKINK